MRQRAASAEGRPHPRPSAKPRVPGAPRETGAGGVAVARPASEEKGRDAACPIGTG